MHAQHIFKPNQTRAGVLLAEKEGLVWKFAWKAFNKMFFLPPFDYTYVSNKITIYSHMLHKDTLLVFLYLLFI